MKKKLISRDQYQKCISIRQKEKAKDLSNILLERGYVDEVQLKELMKERQNLRKSSVKPVEMTRALAFGKLAVDSGLINEKHEMAIGRIFSMFL